MEIVFTNLLDIPMEGFEPQPAKKIIPDWYKHLESYMSGKKSPNGEGKITSTIKKCMPVFDAISAGYLIFSHTDIYISNKDGELWYEWPSSKPLEFHMMNQAPTHPKSNNNNYPKWQNPWGIKTPKGYSCLFIPPTHRESPFAILEGIVDTDTYHNAVNFPFVVKDTNFEGLIPAGTPIVQVIPFKRDNWSMKIGGQKEIDLALKTSVRTRRTFFDGYKNFFRQEKTYN